MRSALYISVLLLLLMGLGAAYEYHMPVNIQATVSPSVLMPGDEAIMAVELQNGAASYGSGGTAGAGTQAYGTQLSTPINKTVLKGSQDIQVLTPDYSELGMLGPNDKATVYYKIKAKENVSSGTYLLDFSVVGGYDTITINRQIPVKVDLSSVSIARADVPTKPVINLNIANPRENTLNAVTIIPSAPGIRFSPDRYYIGTMDPDEVFTISFGIDSESQGRPIKGPVNLTFTSEFKSGDTWHRSAPYLASYVPPIDSSKQNSYLMPAGVAVLALLGAGFYLYRRKKNNGKQTRNDTKSA